MRCAIIPPHILEHVASRSDDPELRAIERWLGPYLNYERSSE